MIRFAGFRVRATVRGSSDVPAELRATGVEVVLADVTDKRTLTEAVKGCRIVINCAGVYRWWVRDPRRYTEVNEVGARNLAEVCAESETVKHLVHISTAMAYGYPAKMPFTETSEPGPFAAEYTRTKREGDKAVLQAHAGCAGGFRLDVLYLACVTGAGDTFAVGRPAAVYRWHVSSAHVPMCA